MQSPLLKKVPGAVTVICLISALASSKMDWHWTTQSALWLGAVAGFAWVAWDRAMPGTRDETARAAQPGLYEGSQYDGGTGGGSGDG